MFLMDFKTYTISLESLKKEIHQNELPPVVLENGLSDLKKIHVIISFGEGFWGGTLTEYTLVYHMENDSFYWFEYNPDREHLLIKPIQESDSIFQLLLNYDRKNDYDPFNHYFENEYESLGEVQFASLKFQSDYSIFMYDIWSPYTDEFYTSRSRFATALEKERKTKKQNNVQQFFDVHKHDNLQLSLEHGKLYVVFDNGIKKEIHMQKEN